MKESKEAPLGSCTGSSSREKMKLLKRTEPGEINPGASGPHTGQSILSVQSTPTLTILRGRERQSAAGAGHE